MKKKKKKNLDFHIINNQNSNQESRLERLHWDNSNRIWRLNKIDKFVTSFLSLFLFLFFFLKKKEKLKYL